MATNLNEMIMGVTASEEGSDQHIRLKYLAITGGCGAMTIQIADDDPKSLLRQIKASESRMDAAYSNWDAEAYEGACAAGNRLYNRLRELVGEANAQEMVQR